MSMHRGCLRPLLISLAVTVVLLAGLVLWHGETVALMWENAAVMGEGMAEAEALRTPADLLAYVRAHPQRASLVVVDAGADTSAIGLAGDVARPVPGLSRLLVLATYARDVTTGRLDSSAVVPLDTLARYHLPRGDDQPWRHLVAEAGADSAVSVAALARLALRRNHATATGWLLEHQRPVPVPGLDAPRSHLDLVTTWMEAHPGEAAGAPRKVGTAARRYRSDPAFRDSLRRHLRSVGTGLSLAAQRRLARETLPRGTAAAYADLLLRVVDDRLVTPEASRLFRDVLEGPAPETGGFDAVATEGGSMPGHIAVAAYGRRADGTARVVVLLLEDLPMAVYYRLTRTGLDKGLVLQLLADSTPHMETL